jgi:trehalose/maltose hydrolase-like predicted phosphorylase
MHWCGESFTADQKARNLDYYERLTVRDSSLSACTQAVMCAEVGHLELAHAYAAESALVDLHDLHDNAGNGLHMASLAGTWSALVEGFGGMRENAGTLCFDPALPPGITRLAFHLQWRGALLRVDIDHVEARFTATERDALVQVAGSPVTLTAGTTVRVPLTPRQPLLPPPVQAPGEVPVPASERYRPGAAG